MVAMKITFGWGLDGAAWEESGGGADPGAAVGRAVLGPAGLAALLRTRLGLTGFEEDHPLRVAAYRDALAGSAHAWCAESFGLDPWAVAKKMLSWRDELVAAGWDGAPVPGGSPRLGDLAAAEVLFDAPGPADGLRRVAATLRGLVAGGVDWPLGIDLLTVVGDTAELPAPWPGIISDLEALGVPVAAEEAPEPVRSLQVITAPTEWEAAEAAARIMATIPDASLVATHHSEILDQELSRRGLPRLGALESSDQRATAQVLPLFLAAVSGPIDVHAIAAFLDMGLTTVEPESGELRKIGVVPGTVRWPLLQALTAQPGVGGPEWRAALEGIGDAAETATGGDRKAAERDAELAAHLDRFFRTSRLMFDDGTCPTDRIIETLSWLAKRLRNLGGAVGAPEVTAASTSVTMAIEVLGAKDAVSERELQRIVDDCTAAQASPLAGAEATEDIRLPSPALLRRPGVVVWWGAIDDGAIHRRIWTPGEVRALSGTGVDVADPGVLAGVRARAELDGLRRAGDVIAIVPDLVDGAPTARHAALAFAAHDVAASGGTVAEIHARELISDGTWSFGGRELSLDVPDTFVPDAEAVYDAAVRRSVPPGTHLLPTRVSYSQIEKLLVHRLEWLLAHPLRIRQGWLTEIPTGNRMIGTFLHAVVEKLVEDDADGTDPAVVGAAFAELLPHYASELALPGNARLRQQVEAEALENITGLFTTLHDAGMTVTGAETEFGKELTLTLRDPDDPGTGREWTVGMGGFRDLDAETADGRTVVIDMKYSVSRGKYRDLIETGNSLQLASYAWSVTDDLPLAGVVTAYFELKYGRFDSTERELGGIVPEAGAVDAATLWDRAVGSLEDALSEIAYSGIIHDVGNEVLVEAAGRESARKRLERTKAETAAMNDRHLPMDTARYVDYGIITGIEADLS